jgi:hypothetical protein
MEPSLMAFACALPAIEGRTSRKRRERTEEQRLSAEVTKERGFVRHVGPYS